MKPPKNILFSYSEPYFYEDKIMVKVKITWLGIILYYIQALVSKIFSKHKEVGK
jgi:hypothetical protein